MTYLKRNKFSVFFALVVIILVITAFFVGNIQADEIHKTSHVENSQSITLLSTSFAVVVPDAIGGPTYTNEGNDILIANTGNITEKTSTKYIEDTNGVSLYIVREGDTLSEIAELFDVSINTIKWENNLGKTLKIGQELRILPVTGVTHTVKKGDTFGKIASTYNVETEDITLFNDLDANKLKIGEEIIVPNGVKKSSIRSSTRSSSSKSSKIKISGNSPQGGYYMRPTSGRISSPFGPRSRGYHYGIDFANSIGTPIIAAASGTVIKTSCGSGYGICLVIQHDNGTQTLYAHASKLFVKKGDNVKQGQKIANIGNTGRSTGPHLHFEIIKSNGQKMNPNNLF